MAAGWVVDFNDVAVRECTRCRIEVDSTSGRDYPNVWPVKGECLVSRCGQHLDFIRGQSPCVTSGGATNVTLRTVEQNAVPVGAMRLPHAPEWGSGEAATRG